MEDPSRPGVDILFGVLKMADCSSPALSLSSSLSPCPCSAFKKSLTACACFSFIACMLLLHCLYVTHTPRVKRTLFFLFLEYSSTFVPVSSILFLLPMMIPFELINPGSRFTSTFTSVSFVIA